MNDRAIRIDGLGHRYRRVPALAGVDLEVASGEIFALLGPNGAGKTTLIDILLGLLEPHEGSAEVLGRDSRHLGPRELARIGYVSDDQEWPKTGTLGGLIRHLSPLYPTWDETLCSELMERFELLPQQRLGAMSRGERMRARLVTAIAYRPRLLLLDEPFSGLDPMVREHVIEGMLELAGDEPWSIFLATHEMATAERLADRVGFLSRGDLWLVEDLETLRSRCRRVRVELEEPLPEDFSTPETWVEVEKGGCRLSFFDTGALDSGGDPEGAYASMPGVASVSTQQPSLEQVFVALHRGRIG